MANDQPRILVVEDDNNLGSLLKDFLQAKGFQPNLCTDGQKGWEEYRKNPYDLLVLDIMMPVKDGLTLAREIRRMDGHIPIIMLTAKTMQEDTLEGFRSGADDYITKPFSMDELIARIRAILKRSQQGEEKIRQKKVFQIGEYHFNYDERLLSRNEEERKLTTKENDLLLLLCKNMNELLEREEALNAIWQDDSYFSGRSMDVYIAKLRKYLQDDPSIQIDNVHGRGFKLLVK